MCSPWNDERVQRSLGIDVGERHDAIVLVDDPAGISPRTIRQKRQSVVVTVLSLENQRSRDALQILARATQPSTRRAPRAPSPGRA